LAFAAVAAGSASAVSRSEADTDGNIRMFFTPDGRAGIHLTIRCPPPPLGSTPQRNYSARPNGERNTAGLPRMPAELGAPAAAMARLPQLPMRGCACHHPRRRMIQ
jgi:hypothetical protein